MTEQQKEELYQIIKNSFHYGYEDPEDFVRWIHDDENPTKEKLRGKFKSALREVLDVPGTVTPLLFKSWTNNCDIETQEKVQKFFQKLWDACFEGKVIEDWELYAEDEVPSDEAQT